MARRSEKQDKDRQVQIAFYKWEFLRQNPDYIKDYEALTKRHGKALRAAGYPHKFDSAKLSDKLRLRLGQSHGWWRVNFLQNPERGIPLAVMRRESARCRLNPFWDAHGFSVLSDVEVVDPRNGCGDTVRFKNLSVDFRRAWDWLPIAVNLEARPETLQRELMDLVRTVKSQRRNTPDEAAIRLEAKSFDQYLKAWDLKRQGLTGKDIALGLGLVQERSDIDLTHLKLVERALRQAKALIAGDYRRIS